MTPNHSIQTSRDAAFTAEALPWLPHVARFARALTRDIPDADDLVQETYLRAYKSWDTYQPGSGCRTWLFTICRNIYLRQIQRSARMVTSDDPEAEAMAAAGLYHYAAHRGLDAIFDQVDIRPRIHAAIAELPEEYRATIILVDIEDYTYEDAAAALRVPIGTVRSRLFRARRLLQQSLIAFAEDAGLVGRATTRLPVRAAG